MDHAPGPIIASAAPVAPGRMCIQGSRGCEKARHNSATAMRTPATGVHKPISNSRGQLHDDLRWTVAVMIPIIPCWTGGMAVAARKKMSPIPGRPSGNVEKRRCMRAPLSS